MRWVLMSVVLWLTASRAVAGAIHVDAAVTFDAETLGRALALRATGGAACGVVDVRVAGPGVVRASCDGRAVLLELPVAATATDAARAVALSLLSLAEPEIATRAWVGPAPEPAPEPAAGTASAAVSTRSMVRAARAPATWRLGLAGAASLGAGASDRTLAAGRLQLEGRANRWGAGLALDAMAREGEDAVPSMRGLAAGVWITRAFAGFRVGPLASAGVVDLGEPAGGRYVVASVGARAELGVVLTRSMSLVAFGEPTVAVQNLEVKVAGTDRVLASTPRIGLRVGVALTWQVSP